MIVTTIPTATYTSEVFMFVITILKIVFSQAPARPLLAAAYGVQVLHGSARHRDAQAGPEYVNSWIMVIVVLNDGKNQSVFV